MPRDSALKAVLALLRSAHDTSELCLEAWHNHPLGNTFTGTLKCLKMMKDAVAEAGVMIEELRDRELS